MGGWVGDECEEGRASHDQAQHAGEGVGDVDRVAEVVERVILWAIGGFFGRFCSSCGFSC